jgi:CHAT domain-containing protein
VPNDLSAARLALTTILRRKGRSLDAMSEQLAALRRRSDPQDRALLEQLDAARSRLANLVLNGAGGKQIGAVDQQAAVAGLEAEAQRLEAAVSARSAEFRAQSQPVTIESVQQALPAAAALVEIAAYLPFNAQAKSRVDRYGTPRYAAYVLGKEGPPRWVDLGDAAPINGAATTLRQELRNPRSTNIKQAGQELFGRVMRRIIQLLGNTHSLFLSPDGDLNLIPFAALVDDQNRYLIERYSITYLTSGRDLLRLQAHAGNRAGPVIFANPLFSQLGDINPQSEALADSSAAGRRSVDLRGVRFRPLPGTAGEAKALAGILTGARVLTGPDATEAALKKLAARAFYTSPRMGSFYRIN